MGFDEHGRCPMLQKGRCTIYAHRPQACRDYDCRVFAATGINAGDDAKAELTARVERWRFRDDAGALGQLNELGAWLLEQDSAPANPTEAALLCLAIYARLVEQDNFSLAARNAALAACVKPPA